jgi:hypothetical protein
VTAARAEGGASSPTTGAQAAIRPGVDSSRAPSSQVQPVHYPGTIVPFILERLTKALGATRASEVMNERLSLWRPRPLETAQDLLEFSNHLMRCGGLIQAVGRSLKVQALLRGATE